MLIMLRILVTKIQARTPVDGGLAPYQLAEANTMQIFK